MNMGWLGLIGFMLVALKLFGQISWDWLWVLAPFWIGFALWIGLALIIFLILGLLSLYVVWDDKRRYKR